MRFSIQSIRSLWHNFLWTQLAVIALACAPTIAFARPAEADLNDVSEDSILVVTVAGKELEHLTRKVYTNPLGTRVRSVYVRITRDQLAQVGLLLHVAGGRQDISATLTAVSGMEPLHNEARALAVHDLMLIPAYLAAPQDCGKPASCLADRVVIDMRLTSTPKAALWVCHLLLEERGE